MMIPKSPEEFLLDIKDDHRREEIALLFSCIPRAFEMSNHQLQSNLNPLPIRILPEDAIQAEGSAYCIQITTGAIDYCLNRPVVDWSKAVPEFKAILTNHSAIYSTTAFTWILLHEISHINRRHVELIKNQENPRYTQGTEYDADLLAAAAIFRVFQDNFRHHFPILVIRKVTACIFWSVMRGIVSEDSDTHIGTAGRFYDMVLKIVHVAEEPLTLPSMDLKQPEMILALNAVFESVVKCEINYWSGRENERFTDAFHNGLLKIFIGPRNLDHIEGWEEIRPKEFWEPKNPN